MDVLKIGREYWLGIAVLSYQYQKQQLSFYFLYLISKNYLQRLMLLRRIKKYIVYLSKHRARLFIYDSESANLDLVAMIIVPNNAIIKANILRGNSGITCIGKSMLAPVLLIFSILKVYEP